MHVQKSYYYSVHKVFIQVQLWKIYVCYLQSVHAYMKKAEQLHNTKNISEMEMKYWMVDEGKRRPLEGQQNVRS